MTTEPRARGVVDELLDDVRASIRRVLERQAPRLERRETTSDAVADELARNSTAVVVAILEERGLL